MASDTRLMFRWLVDTRRLWRDDFETQSKPFLDLLKPSERQAVLRYYHVKDRAMSLASHLLKYHAISRISALPWPSITLARALDHKPCYVPARAGDPALEFNVSHQAGLVALIACPGETPPAVGIDIVCVHERDELPSIDRDGFDVWVSTYQDVFSARELDDIRYNLPSGLRLPSGEVVPANALQGTISRCCKRNVTLPLRREDGEITTIDSNLVIEAKLRRFYTFWALKEAYVKLTGEALLADWLRDLEFRSVRAPHAAAAAAASAKDGGGNVWGEVVRDVEVWRGNQRLRDVVMEIRAFEQDYIIASAVSMSGDYGSDIPTETFPDFDVLDLERDVLSSTGAKSSSLGLQNTSRILNAGRTT